MKIDGSVYVINSMGLKKNTIPLLLKKKLL